MTVKAKKIVKEYYSIGEVAELYNVNTSLIRYWEKKFDIIKPRRTLGGTRMFTKEDVENFYVIFHLRKERGFTIRGTKDKLKDNKEDTMQNIEIVTRLNKVKDFLEEIKKEL